MTKPLLGFFIITRILSLLLENTQFGLFFYINPKKIFNVISYFFFSDFLCDFVHFVNPQHTQGYLSHQVRLHQQSSLCGYWVEYFFDVCLVYYIFLGFWEL